MGDHSIFEVATVCSLVGSCLIAQHEKRLQKIVNGAQTNLRIKMVCYGMTFNEI